MNEKIDFGGRFKKVRLKLGLTQKDFAEKLEVKQSFYSLVESNKTIMPMLKTHLLFTKFHVSPNWFWSDDVNISDDYIFVHKEPECISNNDLGTSSKDVQSMSNGDKETNISSDIDVKLNGLIERTLFILDFYILGIMFHVRDWNEHANQIPFPRKLFTKEEQYVAQFLRDRNRTYLKMSTIEKAALLDELLSVEKAFLDKIWLITRSLPRV